MNFKRIKDMAYQRNIFVHSSGSLFRQVVDHIAFLFRIGHMKSKVLL